jgi:hypothetical protein
LSEALDFVDLRQVRAELDRNQRALQAALILERLQDVADRLVSWILPVSALQCSTPLLQGQAST